MRSTSTVVLERAPTDRDLELDHDPRPITARRIRRGQECRTTHAVCKRIDFMHEQTTTDHDRRPRRSTSAPDRARQPGRELEQVRRRLDALVGDTENPRIWRGID